MIPKNSSATQAIQLGINQVIQQITFIKVFKVAVALYDMIKNTVFYRKAPNSTYQTAQILDYMFERIIQGHSKLQHMDGFCIDNAYKYIKGNSLPNEKVSRDLIKDTAAEETTVNGKNEVIDITLEIGKHHTYHEFLTFFRNCLDTKPERWHVKRIRGDKGFFDQKNFKFYK